MKKKLLILGITLLLILIICINIILHIQEDLFFYPWHDKVSYEKLKDIREFSEISINNGKNVLHGWLKENTEKEVAPLVIFFGGNAQNSSNTCINFYNNSIYQYFEGYNFLIVDYPGYGLSEGKPSDKTMFDAGLSIYDYALNLNCVDRKNIVVMGYSIGTGVATYVSSQRDVNGLILISPYDRALSLYNDNLNIFYGPLELLAKYKFDSISYAKNINVAPLIITSYDDEVIDYNFSINLANSFNTVKQIMILEKVKHNDYFSEGKVLNSIKIYLLNRL